jgi:hypothetical protein
MRRRTLSQTGRGCVVVALLLLTGSGRAFNFHSDIHVHRIASRGLVVSGQYAIRGTGDSVSLVFVGIVGGHLR